MQAATHKYSGTRGIIMGYHSDRKAYFVKTSEGQEQYWTKDSTIKEGAKMTSKVMLKLTGKKKQWYNVIERYFNNVEDAQAYLKEMSLFNDIHSFSKNNQCATLSNGWTIYSNYDLKKLIKGTKPSNDLDDEYPFDLKKVIKRGGYVTIPSNHKPRQPDDISKPRIKKKVSGNMIKLQELTDNPRKARVILRNLVRQKKIEKPSRWEWPSDSQDLETVKAALKK